MKTLARTRKKLLTIEQFHELVNRPENEERIFELVRGEVIELSRPKKLHGIVCSRIVRILGDYADASGRGYVECNDAGVILERDPDTVRGPDVALFDDEPSEEELDSWSVHPPLLAVEVLSPNDRGDRIAEKIADFLRNGVTLVWVVDPADRSVTVHRPEKPPRILREGDEITGDEVLPGFRCPIAKFFPSRKTSAKPKRKPRNGKA